MADHLQVSTQFTEDVFAKQDHYCKRPKCGALIHQGEPKFYIATIDPGQCGQWVCSSCNLHYLWKPSTTIRKTAPAQPSWGQALQPPANSDPTCHAQPNALRIQQSVNATQHGSSINLPQVVAVSHSPDVQPPANSDPTHHAQPDALRIQQSVNAAQCGLSINPPWVVAVSHSPDALDLTQHVQHSRYSQEYNWWARWSYASPPAETISHKILAHYEGGSKHGCNQSTAFGNICEGKKDIDALISTHDLVLIALNTIIPKVRAFCPLFPWRYDEFTVHDTDWVDLAAHPSPLPYFYSQCVQPVCKNPKAVVFKPKQFTLYVVVPAAQWLEYDAFMEKVETTTSTSKDAHGVSSDEGDDEAATTASHVPSTVPSISTGNVVTQPFHMWLAQTTSMPTHIGRQFTPCSHEVVDRIDDTTTPLTTGKWSVISPTPTTSLPPRKIPALTPFVSPSRAHLREALKSGGMSELNVDNVLMQAFETIQCYPIPTRSLTEILANPQYCSFNLDLSDLYPGRLRVDQMSKSFIGIGGFKMVQSGLLMLTPPSPSGLGSKAHDNVVMKRPFLRPPTLTPASTTGSPCGEEK
ncbi:hypothetical protein EDC04DRAFT_2898066 [Pisolithus marmoratus]|nr:hypothetical protein EDC04DRAFT_2898066 [Pisolithus marmoratus]